MEFYITVWPAQGCVASSAPLGGAALATFRAAPELASVLCFLLVKQGDIFHPVKMLILI